MGPGRGRVSQSAGLGVALDRRRRGRLRTAAVAHEGPESPNLTCPPPPLGGRGKGGAEDDTQTPLDPAVAVAAAAVLAPFLVKAFTAWRAAVRGR